MRSVRLRLWCFCFLLFYCKNNENAAFMQGQSCAYDKQSQMLYQMLGQDSLNTSVDSILEFLEDHINELQLPKHQEIVFVIGANDLDKINVVSLITGAELAAIEPDPCVFKLVDKDGPINHHPPNVVSELIPQLLTDKERGVNYYVLPSFNDKSDVRNDLTAWHLTQRTLQFATGVKFMLVLTYPPKDKRRKASKEEIESVRHLVRNINSVINDIEKYSEALSLVVTNVKNDPSQTDIDEIQTVAHVLRATINDLERELKESTDPKESIALEKDMKLIEVLLISKRRYERIKIMRLANQTGLVSDMDLFQEEKVEIMSMVRRKTEYIPNGVNDFSFNIANETRAHVPKLIDEMKRRVSVDISNIEVAIKDIFEKFEDDLSDLSAILDKMDKGYQEISRISTDSLKILLEQIMIAANSLEIEIPMSTLDATLKHIELYTFLISVPDQTIPSWLLGQNNLIKTTTYLDESRQWYGFLLKLHDSLSEFSVQKKVDEYVDATADVIVACKIDIHEQRKVSDIGLNNFLKLVGIDFDPALEKMTVNSFKLNKLKDILQLTMYDYGTLVCSKDKLLVQGYNVKTSDVLKMSCTGDIKTMEIFVLNNFFIDADLTKVGIDLQLAIIAPKWEIIGKRKITLKGKEGEAHIPDTASHGTSSSPDGAIGQPGKSGFSAGCFLAIGNEFINDKQLEVHLIGGRGGPGQHGGNGENGAEGKPPILPDKSFQAKSSWSNNGFSFQIMVENEGINIFFVAFFASRYKVAGKTAPVLPGHGADGGKEGFGGLKGETFFVGIKQEPEFLVFNDVGSNGSGGRGGKGGAETHNGDTFMVEYLDKSVLIVGMVFGDPKVQEVTKGKLYERGKNGEYNKNDLGIKDPTPAKSINTAQTVNNYKRFLRENLAGNIQESTIKSFMADLESDNRISEYRTLDFVHELESLENHYLLLRNKLPLVPFYESLRKRLSEYAESIEESDDHKKILNFLYASVIGKLSHLRSKENLSNFRNKASIIDLLEYLEIVQKNILKMEQIETDVSIDEQTEEYKNALDTKIDAALLAVNTQIIPLISQLFDPLASSIASLLDIVIKERDKAAKDQEKLEAKLQAEKMLSGIKILGTVLGAFGTIGQGLSIALQVGTDIYMSAKQALQVYTQLTRSIESTTSDLKDFLKNPVRVYLDQLEIMSEEIGRESELGRSNDSSLVDIKEKLKEYKNRMKEILESKTYAIAKDIVDMRRKLSEKIKKAIENCKAEICEKLGKISTYNGLKDIGKDLWNEVKNDYKKTKETLQQLEKSANQFNMWDARMNQIQQKLIPMMFEVEDTMQGIIDAIGNQTSVELDITTWKVQTTMGDFKLLVRQMYDQVSCPDEIVRIIEKIEETFNVMITIFDRIQSYKDQSEFASFVAGVQSPNNRDIADPALRKVKTSLKRLLQSNLVLEQYDLAIHSFKQHFFPFAATHLAIFDLPSSLKIDDTQVLVRRASEEINYLQDQLKFLEVSLGRYDRELFGDIYFNSNDRNIAKPFYIFRSREFKDLFKKLLSGDEIMIRADIAKGLSQNAIKFNEIGIQMKLIDEQMQKEFDGQLKFFGVRMTLAGHVYYKCDQQFYYLPVDDNVVIEYSFQKDSNGKPMKCNDVYRKLSEKHYFLSPYTTWKIRLTVIGEDFDSTTENDSGFKKLAKFVNHHFDLELVGRGQYFRSKGTLEAEICTDVVNNYYESDKASSDVSRSEQLSLKYLLR